MRLVQIALPVLVSAGVLSACGEQGAPASASSVRDSAGVRIVESSAPAWATGAEWHLGDAPLLDLGRLDGPDETQFFRVIAGTRLSDGSFVLGSLGSHDLRRFTAEGEHVWTVGREGEGPGEFVGLFRVVAAPGDTILTFDFRQRRISRFAPDGTFMDSRPLETPGESGFAFVETLLPTGRAVYSWREFAPSETPPQEGEVRRDTIGVHVLDADGESAHELGRFPGAETIVLRAGETDGGFNITISSTPFGRGTEVTAGPSGVWVGDTERFEVRRFGFDGSLEAIVRRQSEPVVVDDALVARAMQDELDEADDEENERYIRRRWEDSPLPPTLPAYEALLIDAGGNLWVQNFEIPGATERRWSVFTPDGVWLGEIAFPDRFRPLEIGSDYVLGRFGDELDVEHIQLWELLKPSG